MFHIKLFVLKHIPYQIVRFKIKIQFHKHFFQQIWRHFDEPNREYPRRPLFASREIYAEAANALLMRLTAGNINKQTSTSNIKCNHKWGQSRACFIRPDQNHVKHMKYTVQLIQLNGLHIFNILIL